MGIMTVVFQAFAMANNKKSVPAYCFRHISDRRPLILCQKVEYFMDFRHFALSVKVTRP